MDPQPTLATDARSLDALRRQAGSDPKAAVRAAAGQFESVFMRQILKSMRDAVPKSGMWEGAAQSTYTDMLDQQLAQNLSGRPGGLADVIARQLGRHLGGAQSGSGGPSGATAPGAAAGPAGAAAPKGAGPMGAASPAVTAGPADPATNWHAEGPPPLVPGGRSAGTGSTLAMARTAAPLAPGVASAASTPSAQILLGGTNARHAGTAPPEAVIRQALAAFAASGGAPTDRSSVRPAARWTEAAGTISSPAQPDLQNLSGPQADFVRKVWPHALLAERSTGVPAAFIVGQAALESGWGRREIRNADGSASFNLFGIKAGGAWQGDTAAASTTEYSGGQATRRVERFRSYGSYGEAFQDWAGMMARSPRYSRVIESGGSVSAFAANMQRAGYATDPAYGAKLEKIIQKTLSIQRLVT